MLERSVDDSDNFAMIDSYGDEAMDGPEMESQGRGDGTYIADRVTGYQRRRVRIIEMWFKMPVTADKISGGTFAGELFDPASPGHLDAVDEGDGEVVKRPTMRMYVALFTTAGMLWLSPSPYRHNRYPFTPIWNKRRDRDNMPYGLVRNIRDIQSDINKRAAKALHILSTNKIIMDEGAVDDVEELREEVANPDAIIVKKQGKQLELNADRELSQWHLELMSRNIQMVQQVGGVTDENLGRSTNAVSGIAIQARQEQGALATAKLFDNYRLAQQIRGEKELANIEQFMSEEKQFRISDAIKANVSNKELLELIQQRWGEGGAGGNRYMIETRKGPVVTVTLEKDDGNKRVVLRGKDLADAIRKEFAVSLEDMKREAEARAAKQQEPAPAPAKAEPPASTAKPKKGKAPNLLDRLENYFQPGRDVSGYGGTDRVISFERQGAWGWSVTVAGVKPDGTLERERTHSTVPAERELVRWEKANPVPAAQSQAATPKAKPAVSANKLFTDDAAAKARELLRKKLSGNTLNSGIDPELLQAGITLAGYHIEKGARTFAAYASAMLADLGEGARPYLKSWYMGVKYDPRATAFDGMSSAAEVEEADVNTFTGATNEPEQLDRAGAPALEGVSSEPVQGAEIGRDTGRGVEDGSGADVSGSRPARAERVPAGRGVADGQGELSLAAAGRQPAAGNGQPNFAGSDERGAQRPENRRDQVEEGPFGPILRGYEGKWREAALELERQQSGDAIAALSHPDVGPIDLVWGRAGNNQHDGSGLAKLISWHPEVLEDLQGFIDGLRVDPASRTERRIQLVSENGRAGIRLDYDRNAKTWLLTAYDTNTPRRTERSSRRLSEIWAGRSTPASSGKSAGKSARSDTASTNLSDAIASRQTSTNENISSTLKDVQSAAVPAQQRPVDYVITDADGLGEGGQKAKFRSNVAAIEVVKQLEEANRPATRDEQAVLAKWVGWGGLRAAFPREDDSVTKGWEKEATQLKELLTKEEYSAAESSTRNAHFTSPEIVDAAWSIAQRLGFKGGQVLEPSVGAGNFLGLMPGDLRGASRITGVELDRITGAIAKNLYPNANIQAPIGFEKLTVPDSYFDLTIGNPPFGSERLYDKERTHLNKLSIHNFFFAKAIETLRPGGVLAMVVTNRFLDGQSAAARNMIQSKADFIGAIRLPNNAFLKNAGTEVTTDIVILQRREEGTAPKSSEWLEVVDYRGKDGNTVPLNKYFANNPDMMLGDFGGYGSMYGPNDAALVARGGQDTPAELAKAIEKLPQNIMGDTGPARVTETVTVPETVNDVQVGTMFAAPDGSIHLRTADHIGQPTSQAVAFPNDTAKERVSGMIRVRDAFAKLRRAQISDTASDQQIENLRNRLNSLYDGFVKSHGSVNSDANKRLFRDDPTWPQISALEQSFDKGISAAMAKKTGEKARAATAEKAAIFSRRTQQPYRRPTSASSAKDALATVLNDYGRINLEAMSQLYGKPVDTIVDELGSLVYRTPTGTYETADQYLSGNVKQKLAEAERAAEQDPEYRRNVNALRDVIPADIEAIDIDVKPGAPWLPANHVEDFVSHIGQGAVKPRAFYSVANAKWDVTVPQVTPAAQTQWGTDRAGVGTVLSAVLNGQTITIHDRTADGKSVVNQAATDAANEKAERVKAEWRKWLWQDDKRRDELARLYNDTFNTDVIQQFDGSHLTLPGKVGDDIIELRPSQKNFIWRTLQSGTALADHTVGAGKTFAAIASIMEKRRTGQARKPMLVVPNHLVGQWAADFVRLYPGAKVLAATKQDFEKDRRKRLFARIATGDWDAVIVAHSSFGRIGIDPNYEAKFIQQQMDDLEASLAEVRRETGAKSRNVAQLTKWRDNLKAKMERLLDSGRKDDGLTFDELGVDALYVDEAHEFKNLAYSTSMQRVAGLGNMAGSAKAADLYMKSRFVLEKTGGNNVVFLTGTPLSNTMAEMFTVQRYLDEKALRAMGVSHFDAWARVFGEVVTDWELSPSGQYKLNSRFAKFVNVPELMQRYRSFADVITNDDIKAQLAAQGKKFPLPKVKGGKDALRVFSSHMFHAAHQMARLKYGLELQELVNNTVDQAKEADDQTRAMTLANELSKRHDWVMNPTGSKVAQTMTSTAFVWYLAASPGAALVNMTQTVMLGLPVLAAKFGGFKSAAVAIGKASADSVAGRGTVVSDRLTNDEKRAMDAFYESGLIDRTQSHDLAGVGETGVEYTPLRAKVMEKISWAFHRAEVWNREVTALAAYRMAREAGQNMSDAIDTAHDLTWKTHFDYSNSSRPAVLQNDFAKVALVFRQHNINMLYRVIRDIHQSFKGETPQARREARYQLAGVMGMMTAMAGVTGTMGFSVAMMLAGALFGDDDDPMAFEDQFKADVVDILGPQLGGMLLNGVPGHYLGIDLSSRIGMPDLWFRSPTRELQGKAEYQYWLSQSLGATVSLGEQLYTGFKVMTGDGDIARGIEMMAPKAVRDLMKAYRYSQEGLATIGKDQVLPADQIDASDIVAQALGFTPAKISETWDRSTALKNAETRVKQKRQRLINKWAMATMAGDKETASEALDGIKAFNAVKVHAGLPIIPRPPLKIGLARPSAAAAAFWISSQPP
jgi:N12 class adenine-specific DNA methylase/predicted RNA methylase